MKKSIENLMDDKDNCFFLSVDCEGPIFDKNLKSNVLNLERFLELNTMNKIYTILFITPYFAEMMNLLNIIDKVKRDYMVIFGLHIHPNNLPYDIEKKCSFIKKDIDLISQYSYEEQKSIISYSSDYLKNLGIGPIEAFRGGYFSIDDNTEKALQEVTDISWESHNIYRKEYNVTNHILKPYPVYSKDEKEEFRLEYFETPKLVNMLNTAKKENKKVIGITHSYLFDDYDFHYTRDKIETPIYKKLYEIIQYLKIQ